MPDPLTAPIWHAVAHYQATGRASSVLDAQLLSYADGLLGRSSHHGGDVIKALTFLFWARADALHETETGQNWRRIADLGRRPDRGDEPDSPELLWAAAADFGEVLDHLVRQAVRARQVTDVHDAASVLESILPWLPNRISRRAEASAWLNVMQHLVRSPNSLGDPADGLRAMTEAATTKPAGSDPALQITLTKLGCMLLHRFRTQRQAGDLSPGLHALRAAMDGPVSEAQAEAAAALGDMLRERSAISDPLTDSDGLNELVDAQQQFIDAHPDTPDRAALLHDLAAMLLNRFLGHGHDADLRAALTSAGSALAQTDPADPRRFVVHGLLGRCSGEAFRRWGQVRHVDDAVWHCQAALTGAGEDNDRADAASTLSSQLQTRFEAYPRTDDVEEAVATARMAVSLTHQSDPHFALRTSNLGDALRLRGLNSGSLADLSEAVRLGRQASASAQPDDPRLGFYAGRLGDALATRHGMTGETSDLNEAVNILTKARALALWGSDDHVNRSVLLARSLKARHRTNGDQADQDLAISSLREAADELDHAHPLRLGAITHLAALLRDRGMQRRSPHDIEQAVELLRQVLPALDRDSRLYAITLAQLGRAEVSLSTFTDDDASARTGMAHLHDALRAAAQGSPEHRTIQKLMSEGLRRHFETHGDVEALSEAIALMRGLLAELPPAGPEGIHEQVRLAESLNVRAQLLGTQQDFDESVDLGQQALAATDPEHPARPLRLDMIGTFLRRRYNWSGRTADLNEAIELIRQGLHVLSEHHPDRSVLLSNLSLSLAQRFERTARIQDIDEALQLGQRAALLLDGSTRAADAGVHANTAMIAMTRFDTLGDLADLDTGISAARRAVEVTPLGHPDLAMYEANLATGLLSRHERHRQFNDLNIAIDILRQAVARVPAHDADRGRFLVNLATALHTLYSETADLTALTSAVDLGREAIEVTPMEHPYRTRYVSFWAMQLTALFRVGRDRTHLDLAISESRKALDILPGDHAELGPALVNYSTVLRTRHQAYGDPADLHESIRQLRQAVAIISPQSSRRAISEHNLGLALRAAGLHSQALTSFLAAADRTAAPPVLRIRAGRMGAQEAAAIQAWDTAADGLAAAVKLLPQLAWHGLDRATQEEQLAAVTGLASDGAAGTLRAGRAQAAVELLDHGRSVLWQHLLDSVADLSSLRDAAPELTERLHALRLQLDDAADIRDLRPRLAYSALRRNTQTRPHLLDAASS